MQQTHRKRAARGQTGLGHRGVILFAFGNMEGIAEGVVGGTLKIGANERIVEEFGRHLLQHSCHAVGDGGYGVLFADHFEIAGSEYVVGVFLHEFGFYLLCFVLKFKGLFR